jgi:hypothetical protein
MVLKYGFEVCFRNLANKLPASNSAAGNSVCIKLVFISRLHFNYLIYDSEILSLFQSYYSIEGVSGYIVSMSDYVDALITV